MITTNEKEIIQRVINGDKDAFEELVTANQKNVYNLALKMTRNAEDALDVSQEAFIKAYRQLGSFRGDSRFSVWLYRLTYNICIDHIRKKKRENKIVSLDYEDDENDTKPIEIPDMRNLPEDSVMRGEIRREITEGIEKLPTKHRQILVMRELTGMSYDEMASTLSINIGTVKSRIARARIKLAKILMESGTFPENLRPNT
ncbi:MAG: sigma-70 family RNA polymerase sigma factor [Oscillospiraceae bacterium]|jgi:RNA polymerase sigma-70 factor (ECF subfamily)|nr:sigma-70 family RNA polymerase sigma factor [Oscillospiraceae bacterium]